MSTSAEAVRLLSHETPLDMALDRIKTLQSELQRLSWSAQDARRQGDQDYLAEICEQGRAKQRELREAQVQLRQLELSAIPACKFVLADPAAARAKIDQRFHAAIDAFGADPRNLVLLGPTGIGKTLGGCAALVNWVGEHPQTELPRFFGARELANAVLQWPLGQGEPEAMRNARRTSVLLLDDLGLEKDHGAVLDVLEHRYKSGLVTITTSGLTTAQIGERYGHAMLRRLLECGERKGTLVEAFPQGRRRASSP